MSRDYPRTTRICGYLHKLITGYPGIIPGYLRPGTLGSVATSTDLSQDVLGYPGTTQTWDSRICGYLHRLISGCPGIIPGCSGIIPGCPGIIPGQLRPGTLGSVATSTSLSQDVPGLSQDNSDLWLPPQAYPRISRDYPKDVPGYLRPGTLGSVATSTHLSQDVLGYPGTTQTWDSRICGYLHRLITGYPGIIPGCPGIYQTWDSISGATSHKVSRTSQDVYECPS